MATIVCFGDSVTQGTPHVDPADTFTALLQRRLNRRANTRASVVCHNSGVGGENTAEGLARIGPAVLDHSPDVVVVEFGLNDIRYEPDKAIAPAQFAANLQQIHSQIAAAGATVVFTTPNPIVNAWHVYSRGTDYYDRWGGCNGAVVEYAEIIRDVAAGLECYLCDIYAAFVAEAIAIEFAGATENHLGLTCLSAFIRSDDGVHPTAVGHELIARELYALIVREKLV
jgi:lysophospholipase L1-like esterase